MEQTKMDFAELESKEWEEAVVVIANGPYWDKEYPLEARSYVISHNANWFKAGLISKALYGTSLDGSDVGVRLDWYFDEWEIEYCYIVK